MNPFGVDVVETLQTIVNKIEEAMGRVVETRAKPL
jgi:hypothetical protein